MAGLAKEMKLRLFRLPDDLLVPILAYVDSIGIVRLFCSGDASLRARLKRLQTFVYVVPKNVGHIDWIKCSALIPYFDRLISVSLIAENPIHQTIRALDLSILPTTLKKLELRFCGILNLFAGVPTMFSHLTDLESLIVEQRSRLSDKETCIWLLDLPPSLTSLCIWETLTPTYYTVQDDTENANTRLWCYSIQVEVLTALRNVLDFKSNLQLRATYPERKSLVEEINDLIDSKRSSSELPLARFSMNNLVESFVRPYFEAMNQYSSLNLTCLCLTLGAVSKVIDFALLPPTLVEICILVPPFLSHIHRLAQRFDHLNYRNFPNLRVLVLGKYYNIYDISWSWITQLPQSLRVLKCNLPPTIEDDTAIQEFVSTLESRNYEYFNQPDASQYSRPFVPALLEEFENFRSSDFLEHATIPQAAVHCFSSLKKIHLSQRYRLAPATLYSVGRNGWNSEIVDWVWPPGVKHVVAGNFSLIYLSESLSKAFSEFLTREASTAITETTSKSRFSKISSSSSQDDVFEFSPRSSSSQLSLHQHSSSSPNRTHFEVQGDSNKFPKRFNFCASTLTHLSVDAGFSEAHLAILPYTIRELRLKFTGGDVWTKLCKLAPSRFSYLTSISLLGATLHRVDISKCPTTVEYLAAYPMPFFDCRHLVNLRDLRISKSSLSWETLEALPPHLESLEIKFCKQFEFSNLGSKSPFPRSLLHLRFEVALGNPEDYDDPYCKLYCPFEGRPKTLSSFIEDESRFYNYLLQGLDCLTSISVPLPSSLSIVECFRHFDPIAQRTLSRWRFALKHWMLLRVPLSRYILGESESFISPSEVVTSKRVEKSFGFCTALGNIQSSLSSRNTDPYLQSYLDARNIPHDDFERETTRTISVRVLASASFSLLTANLIALGYRILFATILWAIPKQLTERTPNWIISAFTRPWSLILPSSVVNGTSSFLISSIPWIRLWFITSGLSCFVYFCNTFRHSRLSETERSLSVSQQAQLFLRRVTRHNPVFPKFRRMSSGIWIFFSIAYILFPLIFPMLFPTKTNFLILEATLFGLCGGYGYRA